MSKEAMKLALEHAKRDERHVSHAETRYWCRMYRDIAEKAVEALEDQPAQQEVDWEKLYRLEVKKKDALAAKYERDTGKKLTRIIPMAEQPAQQALDKMAENARELGLDYEPAQEKDQPVMYTYPSKPEPIPCGKPIGILMKQKGDEHMKLYLLPEQPAQSTADKSELETVPAKGGLLPAQQEPVAWMWKDGTITSDPDRADGTWMPLYTTPQAQPAQRTWVGLTDEERNAIGRHHAYVDNIIRATEAKLREKNA